MIESIIELKPTCAASCRHTTPPLSVAPSAATGIVPGGSRRSGCSFSQPRLTVITSPPKFGFRLMLRSVRIGMSASGASIATPQPYVCSKLTTSSTFG